MKTLHDVPVPDEFVESVGGDSMARTLMTRLAVVELVRRGTISAAKGAEMLGMDRESFHDVLAQQVPPGEDEPFLEPDAPARTSECDPQALAREARALARRGEIEASRAVLERLAAEEPGSDPDLESLRRLLAPPAARSVDRVARDRHREFEWLKTHGAEHRNRWVAVEGNRLLATGENLGTLRERLKDHPGSNPLVHWIE